MKAAIGVLLLAAHAAAFAVIAARCQRDELTVELHAPPASPTVALDGRVPPSLADRITIDDTGRGPGLHRRTWRVRYRGGSERAVGATQLVGPFQPPGATACTGRLVVGQRLLDDGHAGPGTIAGAMREELSAQLRAFSMFPVGDFQRVDRLRLAWARLADHPRDVALVGAAPHGYVRAEARVVFERVTVPITVALVPEPAPAALHFRTAVRAELAFASRTVQWLSDQIGGDALASQLARDQLDAALVDALAPPPPFTLAGGQTLRFTYCDEPLEITAAGAALPFALAIAADPAAPAILPPRMGRGPRDPVADASVLGLDLDLDALNGVLYELWRGGFLDRQLAAAGLDRRFNADPAVASLLSVRIDPPRLRLPPVVSLGDAPDTPDTLRLDAEARIAIHDGASVTEGRVWGGLAFALAPRAVAPIGVELDALALACERTPTTLTACYADLVAAIRGRASELHGALTRTFMTLLSNIFVGRIGAAGLPADLVIRGVIPSIKRGSATAALHLELAAEISGNR
ncbi:MAG TPA: hypothetical protein VFP84_09050 [Kofleriaceae bacterium]|nr:hypothetical protein [Kofleriaceae bacterium]